MMEYKRGDIVLVNFNPQKKSEEISKIRPAIIVSKCGCTYYKFNR